jgi:hypothetical protein
MATGRPKSAGHPSNRKHTMPEFVIERNIPGAGKLTPPELKGISATSCAVLHDLGPSIQWVHSCVTDDKVYRVYNAPSEALIKEHIHRSGFPANRITPVAALTDPTTASAPR